MPRKTTAKAARRHIEDDTPILPHIVADAVIGEVERCVSIGLSPSEERALADRLSERADAIYARNARFQQKIRASGNKGRDALYAYMRHWLASELKTLRPAVFARLPQRFMVGEELDCDELRSSSVHVHATKKKSPAQLDREVAEAMGKRGYYPKDRPASFAELHRRTSREIDRDSLNRDLSTIYDATHIVAAGPKIYMYGSKDEAQEFSRGLPRYAEGKPLEIRSITAKEQQDLARHKRQAYRNP